MSLPMSPDPIRPVTPWHDGVAQWQVVDMLTPGECAQWLAVIDALRPHWVRRGPPTLSAYTLGAATYLDAQPLALYQQMAAQLNPVLQQHFADLYQMLELVLAPHVGPVAPAHGLALPGFHVYGEPEGQQMSPASCQFMEQPVGSIHVDMPYRSHQAYWAQFAQVDFVDTLTFTLCLRAPLHGAGLNVWGQMQFDEGHPPQQMPRGRFDPAALGPAVRYPYREGGLHFFRGHLVHQMAPGVQLSGQDRRVTLQGHAVRADGIWRMFF